MNYIQELRKNNAITSDNWINRTIEYLYIYKNYPFYKIEKIILKMKKEFKWNTKKGFTIDKYTKIKLKKMKSEKYETCDI